MERRKFLKGMAVLAVLPIVGVAEEKYPLTSSFDSISFTEAIDTFGIKEIDMAHLVNANKRSYSEKFVVSLDVNCMYTTLMTPIGA